MNYFAHGRRFLDQPYLLAGTAVPDWLSVVDRKVRARSKNAVRLLGDADPRVAAVAAGIVQHHRDDDWFHQTRAFAELSLQFTVRIRDSLPHDDGLRPSFLGHILVELLLDSVLIEDAPGMLDDYYAVLGEIDPAVVGQAVNRIAARPAEMLPHFITRFCAARFLYDYAEDDKLLTRLNMVLRRVGLPELPAPFCDLLPDSRRQVRERAAELLVGEG